MTGSCALWPDVSITYYAGCSSSSHAGLLVILSKCSHYAILLALCPVVGEMFPICEVTTSQLRILQNLSYLCGSCDRPIQKNTIHRKCSRYDPPHQWTPTTWMYLAVWEGIFPSLVLLVNNLIQHQTSTTLYSITARLSVGLLVQPFLLGVLCVVVVGTTISPS